MEHDRRFCGSDSETVLDAEGAEALLKLKKREKATLILHKRTYMDLDILKQSEWIDAMDILKQIYVDFYQKRKSFDRKKRQVATASPSLIEPRMQQVSYKRYNPFAEEPATIQPSEEALNVEQVPNEEN